MFRFLTLVFCLLYVKIVIAGVADTKQLPPNAQINVASRFPDNQEKQNNCSVSDVTTSSERHHKTLSEKNKVNPDGAYEWSYITENEIKVHTKASSPKAGEGSFVVAGGYQYIAPDNTEVLVNYTADENGYRFRFVHQKRLNGST